MLKILADETLPNLDLFAHPFTVTRYHTLDTLKASLPTHDILLCRSTLPVNALLLENTSIQCVATASSGIDHIDISYLKQRQISLFDAKGCNAHAVADYVTCTLSWMIKHWQLNTKTAGVIGLGHVGKKVTERLNAFGLSVRCYDPLRESIDKSFNSCTLEEIQACDAIFLHANLHDRAPFSTQKLISHDFLQRLAPETLLINAARGCIVDEQALLSSSVIYCTDVYAHEPNIQPDIIDFATLCTPHIAGHSIEAKQNAVIQLALQLYVHFKVSPPSNISIAEPVDITFNKSLTLEENWLKHYDPSHETSILKSATDKTQAFLQLRAAHHFRHDIKPIHSI